MPLIQPQTLLPLFPIYPQVLWLNGISGMPYWTPSLRPAFLLHRVLHNTLLLSLTLIDNSLSIDIEDNYCESMLGKTPKGTDTQPLYLPLLPEVKRFSCLSLPQEVKKARYLFLVVGVRVEVFVCAATPTANGSQVTQLWQLRGM